MELNVFGKSLMYVGILLAAAGALLAFGARYLPLGRLPGDIMVRRGNFSFFFPVVTCILVSVILTL
ncbi:MAG: DUF2905 domain-containing protein, partial [bacterium]